MIAIQFSQTDNGASKGLCLEFILHEYAKALAIGKELNNTEPSQALEYLDKLYTSAINISVLQQPEILVKLCFYCEALVQNSKIGENLLGAIDELRNIITLLRSTYVRQISSIPISHSTDDLQESLNKALCAFFPLLLPVFQASLECESALFALLELRHTLNHHLGTNTVETLLQSLFPEGPEMFRKTISNGFSRRGFSLFFERNEALFEGLEWPSSTHPNAVMPLI